MNKTQTLIVLSSGESEFYAFLKAAAETLGILPMLKDLGWNLHGEVWGDANVALGIITRNGLGKIRHIDTGPLWIHQVVADKRFKFGKLLGTNNPADHFTKHLDENINLHHIVNLGYKVVDARPEDAPHLHMIRISLDGYQTSGNHQEWPWLQYLQRKKGFDNNSCTRKLCGCEMDAVMKQGAGIGDEDENSITMQIGTKAGTRVRRKKLENCVLIHCSSQEDALAGCSCKTYRPSCICN